MTKRIPVTEIVGGGIDIFIVVDGVKIAKRGRPDSAQDKTWNSLEPEWSVLHVNFPEAIEVTHNGVRVH
jgi:hypothetical protein